MSENLTISLRSIQHYMYCPRRYALLELNRDWNENVFVVKANLLHEHVHDGSHSYSDSRKIVRSDMTVYRDGADYDLQGVLDCVEFVRSKDGVPIPGLEGTFLVRIIEYKPKAPKGEPFHETDAIQVYAQKLCADAVWGTDCECFLYYADIRRRVRLPFDTDTEKYDALLGHLLDGMQKILTSGTIPSRVKGQKCSGCSIADLCFPKEKSYSVRREIMLQKEGK